MGCCGDSNPTAFVQMGICPELKCRKYGVAGMVALIRAGDRADDQTIIERRTVCRGCPDKGGKPSMPRCKRNGLALHWLTAVESLDCPEWAKCSPWNKDSRTIPPVSG